MKQMGCAKLVAVVLMVVAGRSTNLVGDLNSRQLQLGLGAVEESIQAGLVKPRVLGDLVNRQTPALDGFSKSVSDVHERIIVLAYSKSRG